MDTCLFHLVEDLELKEFGISYEDLVPVTCKDKCTSIDKFIEKLLKYILPVSSRVDKFYLSFKSKITSIVRIYWKEMVEEDKEYSKINVSSDSQNNSCILYS